MVKKKKNDSNRILYNFYFYLNLKLYKKPWRRKFNLFFLFSMRINLFFYFAKKKINFLFI
jgi:hypothetical protein